MATACIPQITFGFEPKGKPIVAAFDQPHASSDGGAVLLKSLDTQLQLTKRLAGCLVDTRQPGKVQHQALELVRQRVFGLACGYADCNDAARLADDALHKLLLDRDPIAGRALASQPTLSRFENAVEWAPLRDMASALADTVIVPPDAVARAALVTRLPNTRSICASSTNTDGRSGATSTFSFSPFPSTCRRSASTAPRASVAARIAARAVSPVSSWP